jgi:type I restriction enzyme S subunit
MPKTTIAQRTTWTKVAFGDVVQLSRERSGDPERDGHERFVGLEHIDPGDLRLRRWGNVADGVTFTSVFRPGQVLFGKRRAYQRKVAVADFSGVCSGDIYVLEPKGNALLPELLPFICQTEAFFEHAVGTSAGSLSPRTNWESLASFEFTLPPIEEQRRMTSALCALSGACNAMERLCSDVQQLHHSVVEEVVRGAQRFTPLGQLVTETAYGSSKRAGDHGDVPILGIPNVKRGVLDLSECNRVEMEPEDRMRYEVRAGDLLIVRTNGNPDYVGRVVVVGTLPGPFVYASYLIRIRCDERQVIPEFLGKMMNASAVRKAIRSVVRSSAGNYNLNSTEIKALSVPLPALEDQRQFLMRFALIEDQHRLASLRLASLHDTRRLFLKECFG